RTGRRADPRLHPQARRLIGSSFTGARQGLDSIPKRSDSMSDTNKEPMQLDVRLIPPREKHPTIFSTFDALDAGEAFVLINDHDPFPLRYQFQAERPNGFGWKYLEEGPQVWRVEISKP